MNILAGVFILAIGFTLGFKFLQTRNLKKSASQEKKFIDEHSQPNSPLEPKAKEEPAKPDSTILEKKMLYDEELTLLLKIGHELSSSVKIKDVSKTIVENVKKVLNVERCALLLLDSKTNSLRVEYSFGLTEKDAKDTDIKRGESISGWVTANDEMLFIKDMESDYWLKTINKEKYYSKSLVSLPLSIRSKVFGVLNVNNKMTGDQFLEDDLRLLRGVASQGAAAIQNAKLYEELEQGYLRTIMALASALDAKDSYTRKHSEHVTKYATAIAGELRVSDLEMENIRRSGLLHDIGKIGIRDGILSSPRKLTDEEYAEIKRHCAKGEEIISSLPFLKEVASYIRGHHERFDGKGYPDGKKGYQIELASRILNVCDAFDAMTSDRPYRKAMGLQQAREELKKNSGTQFDSEIVNVFLGILENNPDILKEEIK